VGQKKFGNWFLSDLHQISTKFDNFDTRKLGHAQQRCESDESMMLLPEYLQSVRVATGLAVT